MAAEDFTAARVAQTHRGRDQRPQHGVEIEGCPADGFEHIGGRGLLLQKLFEVARLRLHLVEQARILDGDHRLVSEASDQLDLARRECARLGTQESENAFNFAVAK